MALITGRLASSRRKRSASAAPARSLEVDLDEVRTTAGEDGLRLGFAELGNARFAYGLEIVLLIAAVVLVLRPIRND
jgi:hypothetical protein